MPRICREGAGRAERSLVAADQTLTDLNRVATETRGVLSRRGDIEAEVGELDGQIAHDLRVRTRVTRREQPESIIAAFGPRPGFGHDAQHWDTAAGHLSQHQTAFNVSDGLGPRPDYLSRSAYRDSHEAVAEVFQPFAGPVMDISIEVPGLGLSL